MNTPGRRGVLEARREMLETRLAAVDADTDPMAAQALRRQIDAVDEQLAQLGTPDTPALPPRRDVDD